MAGNLGYFTSKFLSIDEKSVSLCHVQVFTSLKSYFYFMFTFQMASKKEHMFSSDDDTSASGPLFVSDKCESSTDKECEKSAVGSNPEVSNNEA